MWFWVLWRILDGNWRPHMEGFTGSRRANLYYGFNDFLYTMWEMHKIGYKLRKKQKGWVCVCVCV